MDRGGVDSFYHYDGLGSTRALSDGSQAVTDTWDYLAYGEVWGRTGTTENAYQYTGEQWDEEIEMTFLRARYYSPSIGRFHKMDPCPGCGNDSNPITLNRFLYGNGNPVIYVDPSGKISFFTVTIGVAVALAALTYVSDAVIAHASSTAEEVGSEEAWESIIHPQLRVVQTDLENWRQMVWVDALLGLGPPHPVPTALKTNQHRWEPRGIYYRLGGSTSVTTQFDLRWVPVESVELLVNTAQSYSPANVWVKYKAGGQGALAMTLEGRKYWPARIEFIKENLDNPKWFPRSNMNERIKDTLIHEFGHGYDGQWKTYSGGQNKHFGAPWMPGIGSGGAGTGGCWEIGNCWYTPL